MVSAALKSIGPVPVETPQSAPTEISLRHVSVAYRSGREAAKTVLESISLEIPSGDFVVLLGETGCGKSTLLRLILGQEQSTSGQVVVDGKPVTRVDARCGYVPQKYSLFPDRTVMGNVTYGPENAHCSILGRFTPGFFRFRRALRARAAASLERMGLRPQDFNKYPHQLSGGMQQRVAIAQAMLMEPPVLLMDEAFSALDPATRLKLQEQLHQAWRDSRPTVVFVTHNIAEAITLGTRIVLMGRHRDDRSSDTNILLNMQNPCAQLPFQKRINSTEFHQVREAIERITHGSGPLDADTPEDGALEDGALLDAPAMHHAPATAQQGGF